MDVTASVVHGGSGTGIMVATGIRTEFGLIAAGLGEHQVETAFQVGLRKFSLLLGYVAAGLTGSIFVINVLLHKPILDALLFSLAIAVGITPQLLPAVASASLATGAKRMSARKVLVKRLVCIEDLGDVDMLFTDKTGTLTAGSISFMRTVSAAGAPSSEPLKWGLLCTEVTDVEGHAIGGNSLDTALWDSPAAKDQASAIAGYRRVSLLPFDHDRRLVWVLVQDVAGHGIIVTKGAPETVLERCVTVPASARSRLDAEFAAGNRVIAVATRGAEDAHEMTSADEHGMTLSGFLVFLDPPKPDAAAALKRLAGLGISVDSATDVAKDAADVILLEKDLNVLADGVMEGRRIFTNTIKYVLMGTSSNFGNMFSAADASVFLPFLPMLPSQILLNNLMYDTSQLAIPTDNVDAEQLRKPSQWDIRFIRRFMVIFGSLSSVFDFILFGVMLWIFSAGPETFRCLGTHGCRLFGARRTREERLLSDGCDRRA